MGVIVTRSQPQGLVRASSLATSLGFTHVWNFGLGLTPPNSISGAYSLSTPGGNVAAGVGTAGRSAKFSGTAFNRLEVAGNPFGASLNYGSWLWVEQGLNSPYGALISSNFTTSPAGEVGGFQIRLQGNDILVLKSQVVGMLTATGVRSTTAVNVGACSIAGDGGRLALFANGRLDAFTPSTGLNLVRDGVSAIGAASDTQMDGNLYLMAFAPFALPDSVLADLTANPWQLFQAPSRRIFVVTAGGIITLNGIAVGLVTGSVAPTISKAATGTTTTFATGTLSSTTTRALTGTSAVFGLGSLGASTSVAVTGSGMTFATGAITPSGVTTTTIALTGQPVSFALGNLSTTFTKALVGQSAAFTAGSILAGLATVLSGSAVTGTLGSIGKSLAVGIQGTSTALLQGFVSGPRNNAGLSVYYYGVIRLSVLYTAAVASSAVIKSAAKTTTLYLQALMRLSTLYLAAAVRALPLDVTTGFVP